MSDLAASIRDLATAVNALPDQVTAALRGVAHETALRVMAGYQRLLLEQTKAHQTAASAEILDESSDRRFVVHVPGDPARPGRLPNWLEYGTARMAAKPAMRPAGDAEQARYKSDMAAAAEAVVKAIL